MCIVLRSAREVLTISVNRPSKQVIPSLKGALKREHTTSGWPTEFVKIKLALFCWNIKTEFKGYISSVFFLRFHLIDKKFLVGPDQVYFEFYGRFLFLKGLKTEKIP
jgi:hypothetical protein